MNGMEKKNGEGRPSKSTFDDDGGGEKVGSNEKFQFVNQINDEYKHKLEKLSEEDLLEEGNLNCINDRLRQKNKILYEYVNELNETIANLIEGLTDAERTMKSRYHQMEDRYQQNLQKFPDLRCIGDVGDEVDAHSSVLHDLQEMSRRYEAACKEKDKLSHIINKIREGDTLLQSKLERLEHENRELNERVTVMTSQTSLGVGHGDGSDAESSCMDSGVLTGSVSENTIRNSSSIGFYPPSTELEAKQEIINHNWNNFLTRIRVLIKRNDADFSLENENSMHELYESLERLIGAPKHELKTSEVQIDSHKQLLTSTIQALTESKCTTVVLLEKLDSDLHLPMPDLQTLMSELQIFIDNIDEQSKTKLKTTINANGDIDTTGYIDISEDKFLENIKGLKSEQEKLKTNLRKYPNNQTLEQVNSNVSSLLSQLESVRDLTRDKQVLTLENAQLQQTINTLQKQVNTISKILQNSFNSLSSCELILEGKRQQLQQSFKTNQMIGMTITISSLFAAIQNKIATMEGERERSRGRIENMFGQVLQKEQDKQEVVQELHNLRKKVEDLKQKLSVANSFQEESKQMKKFLHSVKLELVHLLGNQTPIDGSDSFGSSITTDMDSISLSSLVSDLKREIDTKDEVLKSRKQVIDNLETHLFEMKRRANQSESDNQRLLKNVEILGDKVNKYESERHEMQEHTEALDKMSAENEHQLSKLTEEKKQLEFECTNQQQTIQHLRNVLEETKRTGNASIKHSKDINDMLNFNIKTLSEQLSELYAENMSMDRQIQVLRDSNVDLREQITDLNKDIFNYKELLELKNLSSQLSWYKENEYGVIKTQTNNLNEEIRKLRELVSTVIGGEEEKKFGLEEYNMDEHETDSSSGRKFRSLQNKSMGSSQKTKEMDDTTEQIKQILSMSQEMVQAQFNAKRYEELQVEMETLQTHLKEFSQKNTALYNMLSQYESKYKDFETQIGKLSHENSNLLHQIDNLSHDLRDQTQKNAKLSEENTKLNTQLQLLQKQCKCMGTSSPEKRVNLSSQIRELRQENNRLKESLNKCKEDSKKSVKQILAEKEKYQKECNQLIEVVGEFKSRVAILEMNLEKKDNELVNALEIKKLAVLKRQDIQKSSSEVEKRHSDILMKNESLKLQLEDIREELSKTKEDHRKREERTFEELRAARQAIRDQQVRIAQQEANYKHLLDIKRQLEKRAEGYLKEIKKLEGKLSGETGTKNAFKDLTDLLEAEQKTLKEKICRLTNSDEDLNKAMSNLECLKEHNHELTVKYDKLQKDYNILRENHEYLLDLHTKSVSTLEAGRRIYEEGEVEEQRLRDKIEELLRIITILKKDRDYMKSIVNEKHRDITILASQLNSLNKTSQSHVEYPTLMHKPFYPSQLDEIPSGYPTQFTTDDLDLEPRLRQLTSTMVHLQETWSEGVENAISEALS